MIVLDASVALKWFVDDEPLIEAAGQVLESVESSPGEYLVPEIFITECLAVLCRMKGASAARVQEALSLLESLGIARVASGHELLELAATYAVEWKLSGYDATYVALADLTGGIWLTADARAARRVPKPKLVKLLGA